MVSPAQASWQLLLCIWPPSLTALSEASLSAHLIVALAGTAVPPNVPWTLGRRCPCISSCVPVSFIDRHCRFWGRCRWLLSSSACCFMHIALITTNRTSISLHKIKRCKQNNQGHASARRGRAASTLQTLWILQVLPAQVTE